MVAAGSTRRGAGLYQYTGILAVSSKYNFLVKTYILTSKCGWAFYNDIPTSVAKVWFPKLDGDNHHSSNADGKSSRNAVFLQNTTLLRCLSSESGLKQRAHGFENVPIGKELIVRW